MRRFTDINSGAGGLRQQPSSRQARRARQSPDQEREERLDGGEADLARRRGPRPTRQLIAWPLGTNRRWEGAMKLHPCSGCGLVRCGGRAPSSMDDGLSGKVGSLGAHAPKSASVASVILERRRPFADVDVVVNADADDGPSTSASTCVHVHEETVVRES
ncbi:Hypothetical protein A7982_06189 [Minicystis rosea]|nr:Hypothetical protein A7982_06189 [Minicystis rosea]